MPHSPSVATFQASNPPIIKHSTAIFLHLTGRITTNGAHLQNHQRPARTNARLRPPLRRIVTGA
jgi:hypothetical protein